MNDISTNADETDSDNSNLSSGTDLLEMINDLSNENKEIYTHFTEKNKDNIYNKINDKMKMNLKYEREFKEHLQKKLNKLDNRLNILQMKYTSYKIWYDRFNILIIVISSLLSIIEAFRNEITHSFESEENGNLKIIFNMVPLSISTSITCLAAIVKFKKYQEKMENMQFTREKVITAISKIKTVQESLWFSNENDFEEIKKKYLEEIYIVYNESNSELERHIKFNDHHKFKKLYQPPPKIIVKKEDDIMSML
jgi:hypothetical protein